MLRIIQNQSSASAQGYYSKADYYSEGQELAGIWFGLGAERLGLSGLIEQDDFNALCENRIPSSSQRITPRTRSDRTVGYDFNFHVPKGVSLAYMLGGDENILDAFRSAVRETMQEIEQDAKTRVRKRGRDDDRLTGNLTWAEFVHFTARPVDGVPDPHLHAHCFVFNQTFDVEEDRWKAAQFRDIKRDAPYYQAAFNARLAGSLQDFGYGVTRQGKNWELTGVSKLLTQKFSRRTEQIEAQAAKKGIVDPYAKDALGAKTREAKDSELSLPELKTLWRERLSEDENETLNRIRENEPAARRRDPAAVELAAKHAIGHCFERKSVVPLRELKAEAFQFGLGEIELGDVEQELQKQGVIVRNWQGREMATTKEVLAEESAMLDYARNGRGQTQPLNADWKIQRQWLNAGQQAAVRHVLTSEDRVVVIKGKAGTGKTSLMQEAVAGIEAGGKKVFAFAPSAEASRNVLRNEGFAEATTVAELLVNEKLQQAAQGQVLWIDEAGLVSSRQLKQVFDVAKRIDARVLLTGDWRQHASVERGSAMRLLEQEAGIRPAVVNTIQRQQGIYRDAVVQLSRGRTAAGFDRLEELGWIRELGDAIRPQAIAEEYANSLLEDQKAPLVVAPTHAEGEQIARAIRQELKDRYLLGVEEQLLPRLVARGLTEAERADPAMIEPGDVIVFTQNAPGHRKGERIVVTDSLTPELAQYAHRYQVTKLREEAFAVGDPIRFTANSQTQDGKHRLNNGAIFRITGFTSEGDIRLENNWIVSRNHGFIAPGYVVTSHASQGKTYDKVLIAESSESFAAASAEQFYVSVSRGKRQALVFTDDKASLRDAVARSTPRLAATELMKTAERNRVVRQMIERASQHQKTRTPELPQVAYGY